MPKRVAAEKKSKKKRKKDAASLTGFAMQHLNSGQSYENQVAIMRASFTTRQSNAHTMAMSTAVAKAFFLTLLMIS